MSWFVIEIVVALMPLGLLLWWTVRTMRRHRGAADEVEAPAADDAP